MLFNENALARTASVVLASSAHLGFANTTRIEALSTFSAAGEKGIAMAQKVNLDAMIKREDFAREITDEPAPEIIRELSINLLLPEFPFRHQLRKPDFQRETYHWSPEQVVRFLVSFIDGAVIPSIILWRSTNFVFVIDGAHRLSALCAWISDDYGDRTESRNFYSGDISKAQMRIAERTRKLVNGTVGSYSSLRALVGKASSDLSGKRAGAMFARPIFIQQVYGSPQVAEDSFFAINTQGTPLDETETFLIKNRRKPVAIAARAIVRSGRGHPYWSAFSQKNQSDVVQIADQLQKILFDPEVTQPLRTLDLPLGGSSSPVDALALLIDVLTVANSLSVDKLDDPSNIKDDETGEDTISALKGGLRIANRITGNSGESLGLHPAVYFSNDKGKHSRFLFLGMVACITERLRNNDGLWFKKFTTARKNTERFLIDNKSLIGIMLQNLGKKQRIPKMRDMYYFLVEKGNKGVVATPEDMMSHLGLKGRTYDVSAASNGKRFTDDTQSQIFYRSAIEKAHSCPICEGLLDIGKSVSYDHITPIRDGGLGTAENGQMVHPYCNTAMKG
jgi:hypothetical protein